VAYFLATLYTRKLSVILLYFFHRFSSYYKSILINLITDSTEAAFRRLIKILLFTVLARPTHWGGDSPVMRSTRVSQTFLPCYSKSHPDVGSLPASPITHEQ